ncbi:hypothetical protein J6590_049454 [Homalodisca vitripennis]|nr:hypothetical protein J6590_049454 [Homalodisca vitripennis]
MCQRMTILTQTFPVDRLRRPKTFPWNEIYPRRPEVCAEDHLDLWEDNSVEGEIHLRNPLFSNGSELWPASNGGEEQDAFIKTLMSSVRCIVMVASIKIPSIRPW